MSMGRKKKIKAYQIPENVLNNLNEHIGNGFFLFCCPNEETGFQVYSNFGNEIEFKALKADIQKWLSAVEMLESQQVLQSLLPSQ